VELNNGAEFLLNSEADDFRRNLYVHEFWLRVCNAPVGRNMNSTIIILV